VPCWVRHVLWVKAQLLNACGPVSSSIHGVNTDHLGGGGIDRGDYDSGVCVCERGAAEEILGGGCEGEGYCEGVCVHRMMLGKKEAGLLYTPQQQPSQGVLRQNPAAAGCDSTLLVRAAVVVC